MVMKLNNMKNTTAYFLVFGLVLTIIAIALSTVINHKSFTESIIPVLNLKQPLKTHNWLVCYWYKLRNDDNAIFTGWAIGSITLTTEHISNNDDIQAMRNYIVENYAKTNGLSGELIIISINKLD